jgi:predicted nuclease of predicted toxin-antitoxin system
MRLRLVIDINLSIEWVEKLARFGIESEHWSTLGDPRATDQMILAWARRNLRVVFTHDLDFGTILALTHSKGPSVVQVRGQDILPEHMSGVVVAALNQHESDLLAGAIVVIEERRSRVRLLPL